MRASRKKTYREMLGGKNNAKENLDNDMINKSIYLFC